MAEWLRRLTRNQIPSGSTGSNPVNCEYILFSPPPTTRLNISKTAGQFTNFVKLLNVEGGLGQLRPGQYDQFKIILIPQWKPTVKAGKTPPPPPTRRRGEPVTGGQVA